MPLVFSKPILAAAQVPDPICSESQQRAKSEMREYQKSMVNFFQPNPDISQRTVGIRINNNAVASSSRSVFPTSTTSALGSPCGPFKLESALNGTRAYRMANNIIHYNIQD